MQPRSCIKTGAQREYNILKKIQTYIEKGILKQSKWHTYYIDTSKHSGKKKNFSRPQNGFEV